MTKQDKLLKRFLSKPKDFTFKEMTKLLKGFGYQEHKSGKTSRSRIVFINPSNRHTIRLLRPHPQNNLKRYQLDLIEVELREKGFLK